MLLISDQILSAHKTKMTHKKEKKNHSEQISDLIDFYYKFYLFIKLKN